MSYSSPMIQQSGQYGNLLKLVAVVRHERISPWEPSVLTKDDDTKELKYNQTQPNSTEPIKTLLWIRLNPIPGFRG